MIRMLCAAALSATAVFAQCGYSPTNLSLPDTSYPSNTYSSGTTTFQAVTSITAAGGNGNLTINGSASVTFVAGSTITLLPGFTAVGGSGAPTFTAKIASVAEYQLTTASSPSFGGTVTTSPCSSNGEYSAGTVVTLMATPNTNYRFSNWSTGSTNGQISVTMSSAQSITATFVPTTPLTLSTYGQLKGVEYFPRGHAWWSMLYDWYTYDNCSTTISPQPYPQCQTGQYVYQLVQSDLQVLSANGINFIHLYLWDQDTVPIRTILAACWLPQALPRILDPVLSAGTMGGRRSRQQTHLARTTHSITSGQP
jgi:hypothetical protein